MSTDQVAGMQSEAPESLARAFRRALRGINVITSMRMLARLGESDATWKAFVSNYQYLDSLPNDQDFANVIGGDARDAFDSIGGVEGSSKSMTENQRSAFQAAVDSASLVFLYSVIDVAASDYCYSAAEISPEDEYSRIRESTWIKLRGQEPPSGRFSPAASKKSS